MKLFVARIFSMLKIIPQYNQQWKLETFRGSQFFEASNAAPWRPWMESLLYSKKQWNNFVETSGKRKKVDPHTDNRAEPSNFDTSLESSFMAFEVPTSKLFWKLPNQLTWLALSEFLSIRKFRISFKGIPAFKFNFQDFWLGALCVRVLSLTRIKGYRRSASGAIWK